MKLIHRLALGAIIAPFTLVAACSGDRSSDADLPSAPSVSANAATVDETAADNSGLNERDRSGATLTPLDQGTSEADRTVTQLVRQSIVEQDGLSIDAQNVKIITQDGVVTLRGPVETAEERIRIAALAADARGVRRVDNQLEIETD